MTKKHKSITILVVVSMFISLFSVNVANVSANTITISSPTINEDTSYLVLYDQLGTYINEVVDGDVSKDSLLNYLKDADFEKAIAQREFIRKAGATTIEQYVDTEEKKDFINWILNSTEAMHLFLEGGEPDTEYAKAFNVWFEIFTKDPDSHTGYELRLAVAAAMKFGNGVPKWYTKRTLVTPYERYEYYKVKEAEGVFPVSMKTRSIWELRNTIAAECSNWDLDFTRDVRHKDRYNEETQKVGLRYPRYSMYSTRLKPNGQPYGIMASSDNFFGPDATLKEVYEIGGVCGTASKLGSITNNAFGIPAFNIGQPRHAAFLYHMPTKEGKWEIGNNAAGWGRSVVGKRTLIPYTNYPDVSNKRPAYWFAYEESREDEEALHISHQLKWIASALTDYNEAQAVRRVAVGINKYNLDVWKDSINAIKDVWNDAVEERIISSDNITAEATSYNSSSEDASKVLDGDINTIWHTKGGRNRPDLPQSITLSFDKVYEINRFKYLPRVKERNGIITEYNLYTSVDGENYDLVSHGNWAENSSAKTVEFEERNAKYVKLEAIKGRKGYASAAELKVYRPLEESPISIEERVELLDFLMDELSEHPRPVYDMFNSMKKLALTEETPRKVYQDLLVKIDSIIMNASDINFKQGQAARIMRFEMGGDGFSLADFNFNGERAGILVGSKTDTEYSLDGGISWKSITEENMKLSPEEINSITAENDIRLRIKGTDDYVSVYIEPGPSFPNIYVNDDINEIFGLSTSVCYSIDEGETWTRYKDKDSLPDLTGDLNIMLRIPGVEKTVGSETRTFEFKSIVNPEAVLPSDIKNITTNAERSSAVEIMYDGNRYSYFSTNYKNTGQKLPHSVTLELKEPSDIYKLEYTPKHDGYSTGRITEYKIYTSTDGENFTLVSEGNWSGSNEIKTSEFSSKNAKYIKLEALEAKRNYICIGELKLYKKENLLPNISFDFENSNQGTLVGSNINMEYSIDDGETWKDVTEVNMTLPAEDFMNINPESIIKVRFKNETDATEISFNTTAKIPEVEGDDKENTISGLDDTMEYSTDGRKTWTGYDEEFNMDLRGNIDLYVRYKAYGATYAGEPVVLNYTAEKTEQFDERVTYKFISKATGRCIDVKYGSKGDNADITQFKYRGTSNQIVNLVNITDDQYKIVMKNSNKVIVPKDSSVEEGTTLAQTTYTGSDIEKWEIINLGNNEYEIINVETGFALTADNGKTKITNSKLVHSNNQVWKLNYTQSVVIPEVSFNLTGVNARRIMGSTKSMEYTIDGGETWKSVTRSNMFLYPNEISALTSEHGIKVRVKGNAGIANIEIEKEEQVDTTKLQEAVKEGEALVEADYNKDSWANLQEKLDVAKSLLSEDDISQTRVDEALEELQNAISNLESFKGESPVIDANDITIYEGNDIDLDDILSKVTAADEEDGDLSSEITYTTDYVQDELGEFEIVYSVTDSNGNETTKRVKLNVLEVKEKFVYANDLDWVKATTQYRRVLKNKSIKGRTLRLWDGAKEVTFNKGIGTHANSEIIYDLENKGFKYFTSYIGVNRTADHRGSVVFKVFVDDELTYTSEIMKRDTPLEYVKVNVEGADNIKLVVENGGNGNASDHSNWADTKFLFEDDNFVPIDTYNDETEEDGILDETMTEEDTTTDETMTEENATPDETTAEEDTTEENVTEESTTADETITEEDTAEENVTEESTTADETITEEDTAEENVTEEDSSEDELMTEDHASKDEIMTNEKSTESETPKEEETSTENNIISEEFVEEVE